MNKKPTKPNLTIETSHSKASDPFFRNSRVNTCSKIVIRNGVPVAICNRPQTAKAIVLYTEPAMKEDKRTIYQVDYAPKPNMHAGMKKKPLVPYTPDCYRNLLPVHSRYRNPGNTSQITLGDPNMINRKQWKSTHRVSYTRPKSSYISNQGILSDQAKRAHYKLNNIEY